MRRCVLAGFALSVAMLASITRSIRRPALVLCLLLALLGGASLPGAASAELSAGGGLVELASKATQEEATTSTATTPASEKQATETTSSIPSSLIIAAVLAGALLLGGIAFVIVRDARSVAPVAEGSGPGASRNPQVRLQRRRAKAKAAKRQRRRNR